MDISCGISSLAELNLARNGGLPGGVLPGGVNRVQSEGQLRVRLRGPLPALREWQEPPRSREEVGGSPQSLSRASVSSSKRIAQTAPYDVLRPTLRQVDAGCKIPTALSRMAAEPLEPA